MRCLRLTVSYDGTDFSGWQVQPGRRTVQQTLEEALAAVTGESRRMVASGRTDAGVHALGQVVSCISGSSLPPETLCRALNANTPHDIVVLEVADAPQGFHAIRDAIQKRYRYVIQVGALPDVFSRRYVWHIPQPLDDLAMSRAAEPLKGTHDFASFQASGSATATTVRTISDLTVTRQGEEPFPRIVIEVAADGFLYNMVRNIVGTLVEVGHGNQLVSWPAMVLAAKDRRSAGATAPARGLFLVNVDYGGDR